MNERDWCGPIPLFRYRGVKYRMGIMISIVIVSILAIACGIIAVAILISKLSGTDFPNVESPQKTAGRWGERIASGILQEILSPKDVLLTNVELSFDGKRTELDNVIINNRGVFIIEVKNYSGELFGTEEDYEWIQSKMTSGGNFYQKQVKNPIKQVNRQIYILSKYLQYYNHNVWVEGYVFLLEQNSPVEHDCILRTSADIERVIHKGTNNNLTEKTKAEIISLLAK